jgi:hypothetical protein
MALSDRFRTHIALSFSLSTGLPGFGLLVWLLLLGPSAPPSFCRQPFGGFAAGAVLPGWHKPACKDHHLRKKNGQSQSNVWQKYVP